MEDAGLLHSEHKGRETLWQLDRQCLVAARRYLDLISQQWDNALTRLRTLVEDESA